MTKAGGAAHARNELATTLANKLTRISWTLLQHQRPSDTHLKELPAI